MGKQNFIQNGSPSRLFDTTVDKVFASLKNANIRTRGPEIIFGKIYDAIGFNGIKESMFRHLVIARIAFPLSKLKTVEYLYRYQGRWDAGGTGIKKAGNFQFSLSLRAA